MRKTIYMLTAAALVFAAAPAHANANASDGKVGLSVYGKGLRVDDVGAHMEGHGTGVRARLITYTPKRAVCKVLPVAWDRVCDILRS